MKKRIPFKRFAQVLVSSILFLSFVLITATTGYTYADSSATLSETNIKLLENCTAEFDNDKLTVTDTDDNNDVWSSKLLLDSGMELTPGEQYKLSYDLSGENGVGEFFLCKSENIDDRYDGTFASEEGNRSISFTATGSKVYYGMQVGNLGKGNSATATISDLCKLSESEYPSLLRTENCEAGAQNSVLSATDTSDNNDVWNSKILYDHGIDLEIGKIYKLDFSLSGDNGVGEFFICKSQDLNDRYDETFTNTAGSRSVTFKAVSDKLYIGMQFGNLGKGNSVTAEIAGISEVAPAATPQNGGSDENANATNCTYTIDGNVITVTDLGSNNDVWNSQLLYDAGIELEPGKTYEIRFTLTGDNGVGEFFLCKSMNIDDRYHETFTSEAGEKVITFTATGNKAYIGMQVGNVGQGNTVTANIAGITEVASEPEQGGESEGDVNATNCTYTVDGNVITVTDMGSNNDVWDSKLLYDAGIELEPGKTYEIRFTLTGDNGVGEFFLCKSMNIDDRYHETFTSEAGEKVITFTATGNKAYIGMQVGNLGSGNSVTAAIAEIKEYDEAEEPEEPAQQEAEVVLAENCTYEIDTSGNRTVISAVDTSEENDVWTSKLLCFLGEILEEGNIYAANFNLAGDNGVGEFFFCKTDNLDDRYSFDNTAGDHTAKFTAEDSKLYAGMQFGNIGEGNEVTLSISDIFRIPGIQKSNENCNESLGKDKITITDSDDNNDVWSSKAVYETGIVLEPGKTYTATFTLSGDNGVGEFFFLKSDNIDNRYTFNNDSGNHTVTFTADGTALYFGIQCGNIGKGNSMTISNISVSPAEEPLGRSMTAAAVPENAPSEEIEPPEETDGTDVIPVEEITDPILETDGNIIEENIGG